jgi:formate hydrogenlyase subunit 4
MEFMNSTTRDSHSPCHIPAQVPWLIAAGIALVTMGQFTELVPLLLGVGLLMLGTTMAVSVRVGAPFTGVAVAGNLLVYLGLYALFIGALSHPSPWQGASPPTWLRLTDLAASAALVIASLRYGLRRLELGL